MILRKAIDLETPETGMVRHPSPPSLPPEGLTLLEIQEIASEVGIHPSRVSEAADSLYTLDWSPAARLFGGPAKLSAERSVGRRLSEEEMALTLDLARTVLHREGMTHEVLGGAEWSSRGDFSAVLVRVIPHAAGSRISVSVDRRGTAFLSHWLPMLGGAFAAGISLAILDPSSWQPIAAVVSGWVVGGYALGRTIWTRSTRKWLGWVDELTAKMMKAIGSEPAAEGKPGVEGSQES